MKILGFLLIGISSLICGQSYSALKKSRVDDLNSFCSMLELMHAELGNRLRPLPELVHMLNEKMTGKALAFSKLLALNMGLLGERNFSQIWEESFNACGPNLDDKEYEAVKALGIFLGRYDAGFQCAAISKTLTGLQCQLKKERAELPQFNRMSMGVSLSMGALLMILLV